MRLMLFALVLFVLIARPASDPLTIVQGPGSGWALAPTPERTIKTLYWQHFDRTEMWTRVVPQAEETPRKLPFSLIFSATFKGKILTSDQIAQPPREIGVLAQPDPLAVLPVPNLSFVLVTDIGQRFDLIEKGMASRLISPYDSCCTEAILARIDAAMFRAIAESTEITGHVLGFKCALDRADTSALVEFARSIKLR